VPVEERSKVESALGDLKSVLKGDDKDKIEKKLEALMQASSNIAQQAYSAESAGGGAGAAGGAAGADASASNDRGDVLDAEFEEVKDKDQDRKAS
jgi:molecular chaperone DnaK